MSNIPSQPVSVHKNPREELLEVLDFYKFSYKLGTGYKGTAVFDITASETNPAYRLSIRCDPVKGVETWEGLPPDGKYTVWTTVSRDDFFYVYSGRASIAAVAAMCFSGRIKVKWFKFHDLQQFASSFNYDTHIWIKLFKRRGQLNNVNELMKLQWKTARGSPDLMVVTDDGDIVLASTLDSAKVEELLLAGRTLLGEPLVEEKAPPSIESVVVESPQLQADVAPLASEDARPSSNELRVLMPNVLVSDSALKSEDALAVKQDDFSSPALVPSPSIIDPEEQSLLDILPSLLEQVPPQAAHLKKYVEAALADPEFETSLPSHRVSDFAAQSMVPFRTYMDEIGASIYNEAQISLSSLEESLKSQVNSLAEQPSSFSMSSVFNGIGSVVTGAVDALTPTVVTSLFTSNTEDASQKATRSTTPKNPKLTLFADAYTKATEAMQEAVESTSRIQSAGSVLALLVANSTLKPLGELPSFRFTLCNFLGGKSGLHSLISENSIIVSMVEAHIEQYSKPIISNSPNYTLFDSNLQSVPLDSRLLVSSTNVFNLPIFQLLPGSQRDVTIYKKEAFYVLAKISSLFGIDPLEAEKIAKEFKSPSNPPGITAASSASSVGKGEPLSEAAISKVPGVDESTNTAFFSYFNPGNLFGSRIARSEGGANDESSSGSPLMPLPNPTFEHSQSSVSLTPEVPIVHEPTLITPIVSSPEVDDGEFPAYLLSLKQRIKNENARYVLEEMNRNGYHSWGVRHSLLPPPIVIPSRDSPNNSVEMYGVKLLSGFSKLPVFSSVDMCSLHYNGVSPVDRLPVSDVVHSMFSQCSEIMLTPSHTTTLLWALGAPLRWMKRPLLTMGAVEIPSEAMDDASVISKKTYLLPIWHPKRIALASSKASAPVLTIYNSVGSGQFASTAIARLRMSVDQVVKPQASNSEVVLSDMSSKADLDLVMENTGSIGSDLGPVDDNPFGTPAALRGMATKLRGKRFIEIYESIVAASNQGMTLRPKDGGNSNSKDDE
jgi:hypothetical protein